MEPCTVQRKLECTVLSGGSQSEKAAYSMTFWKSRSTEVTERSGLSELQGREKGIIRCSRGPLRAGIQCSTAMLGMHSYTLTISVTHNTMQRVEPSALQH